MTEHNELDRRLASAADDLRTDLVGLDPGPFRPSRRVAGPAVGMLAMLAVVVAGVLLVRSPDDMTRVETAVVDPAPEGTNPPDQAPDVVEDPIALDALETGVAPIRAAALARPDRGVPLIDPAFGTTITRITDAAPGGAVVPIADSASVWSADERFLLLYRRGAGHELRDGGSGALVRELTLPAADIEQVWWSRTVPTEVQFVDGVTLVAVDVLDDRRTELHRFDGCATVSSGRTPVAPSIDGAVWAVRCELADGAADYVSVDLRTGVEHRTPATHADLGAVVLASGDGMVLFDDDGGAVVTDRAFAPTGATLDPDDTNIVAALDAEGGDVVIGARFGGEFDGSVVVQSADGGASSVLVGDATGHGPASTGHQFALGGPIDRPMLAVTAGTVSDGASGVVDGEVLLIDLHGEVVARLAHHRSSASDYFATPFVSVSPSGSRVVFASDWGGDAVDTYLVDVRPATG